MPPKRKKATANPAVVGTVSTRSTRRQSIVNIEIPKLSRASKSVSKLAKGLQKIESKPKVNASDNETFSDKIKKCYKKFVNLKATNSPPETGPDTSDKDKKALLEILQDWDDNEAEKIQTSASPEKTFSDEIVTRRFTLDVATTKDKPKYSDDSQIELTLSNLQSGSDDDKNICLQTSKSSIKEVESTDDDTTMGATEEKFTTQLEDSQINFEVKDESSVSVAPDAEELIIEEQASIPFADDMIVEEQPIENSAVAELESDSNSRISFSKHASQSISDETRVLDDNTSFMEVHSQFSEESHADNATGGDNISNISNKNEESRLSGFNDQSADMEYETVEENLIKGKEDLSREYTHEDICSSEVKTVGSEEISNEQGTKEDSDLALLLEDAKVEEIIHNKLEEDESRSTVFTDYARVEENSNMSYVEENVVDDKSSSMYFNEDANSGVQSEECQKMDQADEIDSGLTTCEEVEKNLEFRVADMHLTDDSQVSTDNSVKNIDNEKFIEQPDTDSSPKKYNSKDTLEMFKNEGDNKSFTKGKSKQIAAEVKNKKVSETQTQKGKTLTPIPLFLEDIANNPPSFKNKRKNKPKMYEQTSIPLNIEYKQTQVVTKQIDKTNIKKEKKLKDVKSKKSTPQREKDDTKEAIKPAKHEKKVLKYDETIKNSNKSENEGDDEKVRRSSRIKSISVLNKKTTGWGLVKSKSESCLFESDVSDSNSFHNESEKSTPTASPKVNSKDRKWKPFSDTHAPNVKSENQVILPFRSVEELNKRPHKDPAVEARLKQFVHLKENQYRTDRMVCKEAKKMVCDCFLTAEELDANEYGCGEDCLNRLLLIECGTLCIVGDRCTNKRFQKNAFAPVEVFNTDKKGLGLRAAANIPFGEFILEYVGEVLDSDEFDKRAEVYSQDKNIHYYFMALRADAIIDATMKGNISRFINHSCDPNAETQKWTVNGELRIGFFSTRTILAGEEITFDYRFQRYGKEAQKCYCGASICRGWLGEQPDSDEEEEEEEEEEIEVNKQITPEPLVTDDTAISEIIAPVEVKGEIKLEDIPQITKDKDSSTEEHVQPAIPAEIKPTVVKKKLQKKKPRIEMFEEVDHLNEEIEMLVTTGLKNQAHTLKLSRLMVRSKEHQQRAKLLRVLRRGELPCRRLFLDYHGLRLMHGYMIDAQQLVVTNKAFESLRLEMLQTLAVLPIPNKTMLQDSKVFSTVEKWASGKDLSSPPDSESNSPKTESDLSTKPKEKVEPKVEVKDESVPERSIADQEEEIRFLATKLLEEWKNLKEVFRIPKKERIEQMKEHEREANKKFMQTSHNSYGSEEDKDRKSDSWKSDGWRAERYRGFSKGKSERDPHKKSPKPSAEYLKLSKSERRKLFALQHEIKEEERKLKQREMWRQHEMNCMMIGADPRFTAPFDPSRGYQLIWNPQIGQWQNCPIPSNLRIYPSQPPPPQMPAMNAPPPPVVHQYGKTYPTYPPYPSPQGGQSNMGSNQPPLQQIPLQLPPHQLTPNTLPSHLPLPQTAMPLNPIQSHIPLPSANISSQIPPNISAQMPPSSIQSHIPLPQTTLPTQLPPLPTGMPPLPAATLPHMAANTLTHPPPQNVQQVEEDPSQTKFAGPIPPPVKLPPKWKCAKDKYGRPYYYHIKIRKSQWEPPPLEPPEEALHVDCCPEHKASESDSSSDTSSVSSDSSSENSDSDDEVDDTKLLLEVRRQMEHLPQIKPVSTEHEDSPQASPSPDDEKPYEREFNVDEIIRRSLAIEDDIKRPSIDMRLKELDIFKDDHPLKKKRRMGLCEEIIISPRTEEDKRQFKEDIKRYKANKEKLKRQKEKILLQTKKQLREIEIKKNREKRPKTTVKVKLKEKPDFNSEAAKKIKETFRANMASTVVNSLNVYRKPDCTEGRITNTQDFKHLARKLTHFVMLKEIKHITRIEDLTCTDNVKMKAREFIRKYMSKFGEVYVKRSDSPDFKD